MGTNIRGLTECENKGRTLVTVWETEGVVASGKVDKGEMLDEGHLLRGCSGWLFRL